VTCLTSSDIVCRKVDSKLGCNLPCKARICATSLDEAALHLPQSEERGRLFRLRSAETHAVHCPVPVSAPLPRYHEINRNWLTTRSRFTAHIFHLAANNLAGARRSRYSKLMRSEPLASYVVNCLKALVARTDRWTPAGSAGQRLSRHVASKALIQESNLQQVLILANMPWGSSE
jgi:hypothetical protein